jgi:hypothetical protein
MQRLWAPEGVWSLTVADSVRHLLIHAFSMLSPRAPCTVPGAPRCNFAPPSKPMTCPLTCFDPPSPTQNGVNPRIWFLYSQPTNHPPAHHASKSLIAPPVGYSGRLGECGVVVSPMGCDLPWAVTWSTRSLLSPKLVRTLQARPLTVTAV